VTGIVHSGLPAPSSRSWLKELGKIAVDLLFPPRCVACQSLGAWLCEECLDDIEVILPLASTHPVCTYCGLPLDGRVPPAGRPLQRAALACSRCSTDPPHLDGLWAYAVHSGPLREAIRHFKYRDVRVLAAPLGKLMAQGWAVLPPADVLPDAIVPVPLHASRERERGYNQAALLAHELSSRVRLPVEEDVLVRSRKTVPQVGLDVTERRANVLHAFQCSSTGLAGRRVLLVDDVCTSGATLQAASDALREGGVSSVWAYTLARARDASGPVTGRPI
jgi:ComF family protein